MVVSSHEQWKYLELPYFDSDINRRVFFNGERARTWNSVQINNPECLLLLQM